jgi:hypothetical protein
LRHLIFDARAGQIADGLRLTCMLIKLTLERDALRALIEDYTSTYPAQLFMLHEAAQFADYLQSIAPPIPHLNEVLTFERALINAITLDIRTDVSFSRDPSVLLTELQDGNLPINIPEGSFVLHIAVDSYISEFTTNTLSSAARAHPYRNTHMLGNATIGEIR